MKTAQEIRDLMYLREEEARRVVTQDVIDTALKKIEESIICSAEEDSLSLDMCITFIFELNIPLDKTNSHQVWIVLCKRLIKELGKYGYQAGYGSTGWLNISWNGKVNPTL